MNFNGFDLNLLVALDALLSERNVTRAAERLHITQPALSNALQRLRQRLDDPLLERAGRELRLTPVAHDLVRPLQELLSRAEQLIGLTEGFEPASTTRTFRIAMSDYCAAVYLPAVTKVLSARAPLTRLEAEPLNERSLERLSSRHVDFCISAQDVLLMGDGPDNSLVRRNELFTDRYITASSTDHPAVRSGMDVETYLKYQHVSYRSGSGVRSLEDQAKSSIGLDVSIGIVAPTLLAMPLILDGTHLLATFPERIIGVLSNSSRFHVYPCPVAIPDLVETLFWHATSETDRGHLWMRGLLIDIGGQLRNLSSETT